MVLTWTPERSLTLCLEYVRALGTPSLTSAQWESIAKKIDPDLTAIGANSHFRKKLNKNDASAPATTSGGTAAGPAKKTKARAGGKRKQADQPSNYNNEDDEESKHVAPKRTRTLEISTKDNAIKVDADEDEGADYKATVEAGDDQNDDLDNGYAG